MGFIGLLGLTAIFGSILGWVAFFRTNRLQAEISALRKELQAARNPLPPDAASIASPSAQQDPGSGDTPAISRQQQVFPAGVTPVRAPVSRKPEPAVTPLWLQHLQQHWMVWLGGGCVGLAGIFLVKYSMDQGLLGPGARVVSGLATGVLLHAGAEWLRRHRPFHPAFAALAGGGSLTLFAALLAALHLYALVSPVMAFTGLALVALFTMALALKQGPVLAILGLLGAYLVPVLVGGGSDGALIVLGYALIISAAALLLMRYIFRSWLWWGMLLGAALWFVLTLGSAEVAGFQGLYLSLFGYLMLAVPDGDWCLRKQVPLADSWPGKGSCFAAPEPGERLLQLGLWAVILLQMLGMAETPFPPLAALNWLSLSGLLLWVAARRYALLSHPVLLMFAQLGVWGLTGPARVPELKAIAGVSVWALYPEVHILMLQCVLVYSGFAVVNFRKGVNQGVWIALAVLAPLLFLALDWRLVPAAIHSMQWTWLAILLAAVYGSGSGWLLRKTSNTIVEVWLLIGAHLGYSLAVALQVREASMTLALAVQLISLAWLIRRYRMPALGWMLKVVAAIVVIRLTLNPWLLSYPTDIHWSLWTYGGAFVCSATAAWLLRALPEPGRWLVGAAVHLFALFCWAETRYWLYDGHVYAARYTFVEASITLSIFAALSLIYHWRIQFSALFAPLYRVYAKVLLAGAVLNYAFILLGTALGLDWMRREIGSTPIVNWMIPAFGAPVIWAALSWRYHLVAVRKAAGRVAVGAAFVFINLEIHHLWQQRICLGCSKSDGELYTYSIIWLLLAAAGILGGVTRFGSGVYKAGMVLLAIVIAKLFLVDMAGLEGLWRVASFMGMGLGLLALGYLHQRLQPAAPDNPGS